MANAMASTTISGLVSFGKESKKNLELLKTARASAFTDLSNNKGGSVTSGSANGVSFSTDRSMTVKDWFDALGAAINQIEAGSPGSRSYGTFY